MAVRHLHATGDVRAGRPSRDCRRRVDGIVALDLHDVGWTFIPATAWTAGDYNLVAQGFLEDPQGNQIGRAFEVSTDLPDSPRASGADETDAPSRLPFTIGSTR